jgi:hypothetical protein
VDTACPAHIIVETYSRKCNVYFSTIRQMLAAPIHRVLKGQPVFVVEFSWMGMAWLAHIIAGSHSQEYNAYFRAMGQRLTAPDPEGA